MKYFISSLMFLCASASVQADSYDPTNDLLAAFSSQCGASGPLTEAATNQSSALKGIISSLRNDTACQSLVPLINAVEGDLAETLQNRDDAESLGHTVDDLNAAIQVETARGSAVDANYLAALKSEVSFARIRHIRAKQDITYSVKQKPNRLARNFYNHSTAFLDGLSANSECLKKHPNILAQAGAQILKSSSDFASGIAGSLMLTAGGAIDHFVQFVRNYKLNRNERDLITVQMGHALGCTFEGLANTYCRARDLKLVADANRHLQEVSSCTTVGQGTNLLGRDLGAFEAFVTSIYAGSPASSSATATEKIGVIGLRAGLDALKVTLDGGISQAEKNYNTATTDSERERVVESLVQKLTGEVMKMTNRNNSDSFGNSFTQAGPIGDAFIKDPVCGVYTYYYTQGRESECKLEQADNQTANKCKACLERTGRGTLPTISQIKTTSQDIITLGSNYVAQQGNLYSQNNPQLALTNSETYGRNQKRGRDFLIDAKSYLESIKHEADGIYTNASQMRKSIDNALLRIGKILFALDKSAADPAADPADTTKEIINLVAPGSDTNFIPRELGVIVKHDIDHKLMQGKFDPNLATILELSSSNSLAELLENDADLEAIRSQVRDAKKMTRGNLDAVGKIFGGTIEEILKKLKKGAADSSDDQENLGMFCIQTLLIPSAPSIDGSNTAKYCKGTKYKSLSKHENEMDYDKLAAKPHEERACVVYDFYRRDRLMRLHDRTTARGKSLKK